MANSRVILITAVILFCLQPEISGQTDARKPGSAELKFSQYLSANHFQDLFIHCDRDTYVAGEAIYIKAYLFDRDSLVLSGKNSFAYVELINPLNVAVARIKVLLENGKGDSFISIPDTLLNGRYTLRAYTNWMKNFMPGGCFMKSLDIVNPFNTHFADLQFNTSSARNEPVSINFWPEGGKLIAGVPVRVGIFVADRFGNPARFSGALTDSDGNEITSIKTDSTGLGLFEFTPARDMIYTAVNANLKGRFPLPFVNEEGFAIKVEEIPGDSLQLQLFKSKGTTPENSFVELIIRSLGKILYSKREFLFKEELTRNLPLKIFASGINDIVLFDGSGNPVSERFIYINSKSDKVDTVKTVLFGKRQKASFNIHQEDSSIVSDLKEMSISISVVVPGKRQLTVNQQMLFGSEYRLENIKQDIGPLFLGSSSYNRKILLLGLKDNLIDWNKIITSEPLSFKFADESDGQYLVIDGSSSLIKTQEMYKPAIITYPGKIPDISYSFPDSLNRYRFFIEKGDQEKDIVIQMPDSLMSTGYKINSAFSNSYISKDFQTDTGPQVIPDFIKMMSRNFQVLKIHNIPVTMVKKNNELHENEKTRFYGKPDQELIMKDYISLPAMKEVFFELIPGVTFRNINKVTRLYIIDPERNSILEGEPALFIDGVMISNPSEILDLNPERVEKIDIVTCKYLVGDLIFPGLINVITKTGDFSNIPLPANAIRMKFRMFDPPAEYLSPDYSDTETKKSRVPDFRNTIFWSYGSDSPEDRLSTIEFETSDFASDYIITIAAIDKSGRPVSFQRVISVK